jgi:ribosomal protein S18 acetylase RimI-like enzyme
MLDVTVLPRYSLRLAALDDFEALFVLHREALGEYVAQTWGSWDEESQRRYFREHWPDSRLALEVGGKIAGFVDIFERADALELANIELGAGFRERGIGSAVIRDLQDRARGLGCPVELQVLKVNPARALYARLGFELTGETETHFQMRWQPR